MDVNDYAPRLFGSNPADWLSDAVASGMRRHLRERDIRQVFWCGLSWERLQSLVPSWGRCSSLYASSERGIRAGLLLPSARSSFRSRPARSNFFHLEHAPSSRGIHAVFSLASGRVSHFLLRGQEKVTKEKATPHSRLTHSPCAPGTRACSGVRRQSIRGLASNWPTSCGPSFGHSLHSPAASDGTLVARILRARATAKGPSSALRAPSPVAREKEMPEQSCSVRESASSWLRTMRSDRGPYAAAKWWRNCPKGGSQGCEPVGCQSKDGLSANPGTASRSRRAGCPETAASGWPSLWLLSLGHARESDSLAGGE